MFFIGFFSTPLPYIILMCFYMWAGLMYMTHSTRLSPEGGQSEAFVELRETGAESMEAPDFTPTEPLRAHWAPLPMLLLSKRPHAPPDQLQRINTFTLLTRPPPSGICC